MQSSRSKVAESSSSSFFYIISDDDDSEVEDADSEENDEDEEEDDENDDIEEEEEENDEIGQVLEQGETEEEQRREENEAEKQENSNHDDEETELVDRVQQITLRRSNRNTNNRICWYSWEKSLNGLDLEQIRSRQDMKFCIQNLSLFVIVYAIILKKILDYANNHFHLKSAMNIFLLSNYLNSDSIHPNYNIMVNYI